MKLTMVLTLGLLCGSSVAALGQIGGDEPGSHANDPAPPTQPSKPIGPMRISGGVMAGQLVKKVMPAFAAEGTGTVVLHIIVGRDGHVISAARVTGTEGQANAAIDAVLQWVYRPFLLNGEPVEVDTTVVFNVNRNAEAPVVPHP